MERPLNIHPNIWNLRQNKKCQEIQQKNEIQLDQFTKLQNAIDMIVQGIFIFKKTHQDIDFNQYSQKENQVMSQVNKLIDNALIPYTIDIIKQLNKLSQDEKNEKK